MKTKIGFCLAFILITVLTSCAQEKEKEIDELLKDQTTQNEIMESITQDHEMMINMMNHIMINNSAMEMMKSNTAMMQSMMQSDQMTNMMKGNQEMMSVMIQQMMHMAASDTTACQKIGAMIMENEHMKSMIRDMMNRQGMIMGKDKTRQMHMEQHHHNNE